MMATPLPVRYLTCEFCFLPLLLASLAGGVRLGRRPELDRPDGISPGDIDTLPKKFPRPALKWPGDSWESDKDVFPMHVPNQTAFREKWVKWAAEEDPSIPEGYLPSMLIGMFTTLSPRDKPYLDVVLKTLLKHPLVCMLQDRTHGRPAADKCRIFLTFVVGHRLEDDKEQEYWEIWGCHPRPGGLNMTPALAKLSEDFTLLPIEENMNCGKTRAWFTAAAREHRWPDYIGKMDVDTFLHAGKLLSVMRDLKTPCKYIFGGKPWICPPEKKACPPEQCWGDGPIEFSKTKVGQYDFLRWDNASHPECWHYMQGGFYFMSRQLAQKVTEAGAEDWAGFDARKDAEDASTGHGIIEYARKHTGMCVTGVNVQHEMTFEHLR